MAGSASDAIHRVRMAFPSVPVTTEALYSQPTGSFIDTEAQT